MATCSKCGAETPDDMLFCTSCGYAVEGNTGFSQPEFPSPPTLPTSSMRETSLRLYAFVGYLLLFAIPIFGWLACLIMAFVPGNKIRRNLARACLVVGLIGIGIVVVVCITVDMTQDTFVERLNTNITDYVRNYIRDTTGGMVTDFEGTDWFKGLSFFDILKMFAESGIIGIPGGG
jgi:hypothetical protein